MDETPTIYRQMQEWQKLEEQVKSLTSKLEAATGAAKAAEERANAAERDAASARQSVLELTNAQLQADAERVAEAAAAERAAAEALAVEREFRTKAEGEVVTARALLEAEAKARETAEARAMVARPATDPNIVQVLRDLDSRMPRHTVPLERKQISYSVQIKRDELGRMMGFDLKPEEKT